MCSMKSQFRVSSPVLWRVASLGQSCGSWNIFPMGTISHMIIKFPNLFLNVYLSHNAGEYYFWSYLCERKTNKVRKWTSSGFPGLAPSCNDFWKRTHLTPLHLTSFPSALSSLSAFLLWPHQQGARGWLQATTPTFPSRPVLPGSVIHRMVLTPPTRRLDMNVTGQSSIPSHKCRPV